MSLSELDISPLREWFAINFPRETPPPEESALREVVVAKYVAAKAALEEASQNELALRGQLAGFVQARSGTQTVDVGKYQIKISQSQKATYSKSSDGTSEAMRLYAEHEALRDVFRVSFEERVAEMEKRLSTLELTDSALFEKIMAVRTLQLSSPQVKVELR